MHVVLNTMNELHDTIPAMKEAWLDQNQVFLGASGVDTYHLMTNFPVDGVEDLAGRKILAPGPAAKWLEGTGAVAVDGGLPTYYTQIQTGVAEGVVIILSGAYPFKIHEVAPHITLVGIGAQMAGAMAINLDTWESLPDEAQEILAELGREYSTIHADQVNERVESFKEKMAAEGATISERPAGERDKWVAALPDIAGEWVTANEATGLPASEVLDGYLEGVRARGGQPARDWDQE
jgi:TRAP-type C4-dicarboxylate transport system substrate-binding protein